MPLHRPVTSSQTTDENTLAVRALARVAPRLAKVRTRNSLFKPTSIDYDVRIFSFNEETWTVSLRVLEGRERFSLDIGHWQRNELSGGKLRVLSYAKEGLSFISTSRLKKLHQNPKNPRGFWASILVSKTLPSCLMARPLVASR